MMNDLMHYDLEMKFSKLVIFKVDLQILLCFYPWVS